MKKEGFQQLIVNALKFKKSQVNPIISISIAERDGFWQFAVKDNGIGIEQKHLALFIFYSLSNGKTITPPFGRSASHP